MCHHPLLPLENVLVPSYNSARCVMQAMPSETGRLYICGCVDEQECNDKLIFYNASDGKGSAGAELLWAWPLRKVTPRKSE